MSQLLMRVQSNMVLAMDLRPSILEIYDDKMIFKDRSGLFGGEEAVINYDQVAEVNQFRGIIDSRLEIVNEGGADDIEMEHVLNGQAAQAKELIEAQSRQAHGETKTNPETVAEVDRLEELAQLKDKGEITEEEFEAEKKKLLGQ